jgi:hypothetical protein
MRARLAVRTLMVVVGAGLCITAVVMVIGSRAGHHARPGLTVLVNYRPRVDVVPGTPLVFQLSIGSSASSASLRVGSRLRPWHTLLRLEGIDSRGRTLSWPSARAGSPRSIQVIRGPDGKPKFREFDISVARLEAGRHVHTAILAAGPDETAAVAPGTYRFRAVIETPPWMLWGWRGRQVSQPVTVVVRDPSEAGSKRDALEKQRLQRTADFYLGTERFEEAEKAARQLVAREPDQAHAHVLLGDALIALNRRDEALTAYRRAIALIPASYEEPTMLMNRIQLAIESARR